MSRAPSPRHLVLRAALRRGDPGAGAVLAPEEEEAMRRATLEAAAAAGHRRAGRLARPRPAGPAASRARHLGNTGRPALELLGAAAVAAICVIVAVSWQERLWPHRGGEAGPRPRQQRPAMAARRPPPVTLGPAAAGSASRTGSDSRAGRAGRASSAAPGPASSARAEGPRGRRALLDARAPRRPGTAARAPVAAPDELGELGELGDRGHATAAAEGAGMPAPAPLARADLAETGPSAPPRQVQFSLPGGTRVIWLVRGPTSR